jgi:hypothetical protein
VVNVGFIFLTVNSTFVWFDDMSNPLDQGYCVSISQVSRFMNVSKGVGSVGSLLPFSSILRVHIVLVQCSLSAFITNISMTGLFDVDISRVDLTHNLSISGR